MGQPKKQSSPRKIGLRRSHLLLELARRVNATSPVKARTTKRQNSKPVTAKVTKNAKVAKKETPTKK